MIVIINSVELVYKTLTGIVIQWKHIKVVIIITTFILVLIC